MVCQLSECRSYCASLQKFDKYCCDSNRHWNKKTNYECCVVNISIQKP